MNRRANELVLVQTCRNPGFGIVELKKMHLSSDLEQAGFRSTVESMKIVYGA